MPRLLRPDVVGALTKNATLKGGTFTTFEISKCSKCEGPLNIDYYVDTFQHKSNCPDHWLNLSGFKWPEGYNHH